jgi:hypothetical protein
MSTRSATIFNGTIDPNELNNPKFPWYTANGTAGHYDGLNTLNATLAPFSNVPFDTHYGWSRLILPGEPFPASPTTRLQSSLQRARIRCLQSLGQHRFQGRNRQRV